MTVPGRRTLDDADLLERSRAGDRNAFDVLARRSVPRLVGTALRILGDRSAAEEAAVDAILKAYQGLAGMRGDASFATWTHRIVCRVAIDRLRVRRRAPSQLDDLAQEPADEGSLSRPPDMRMADAEEVQRLRRAVEALPEAQRLVVVLHIWEGLPYPEVAFLVGCSYDAARVNMCHARRALRARLGAAAAAASRRERS